MTNGSYHDRLQLIDFLLKEFVIAVEDEALLAENSSGFELEL